MQTLKCAYTYNFGWHRMSKIRTKKPHDKKKTAAIAEDAVAITDMLFGKTKLNSL